MGAPLCIRWQVISALQALSLDARGGNTKANYK